MISDTELSALVATEVMGYERIIGPDFSWWKGPDGSPFHNPPPSFATDQGLALEAALKALQGMGLEIDPQDGGFYVSWASVEFPDHAIGTTVARAFCFAALRAKGWGRGMSNQNTGEVAGEVTQTGRSTPQKDLERAITDPNFPKNEREWWAHHRIAALEADLERLRRRVSPATSPCSCPEFCTFHAREVFEQQREAIRRFSICDHEGNHGLPAVRAAMEER